MIKKIQKRLPQSMFPQLFPTPEKLQRYFNKKSVKRAGHVGALSNEIVKDNRESTSLSKYSRELITVQEELPALLAYRDSLPEGHKKRDDAEHKVYTAQRTIKTLEKRVEEEEEAFEFVCDVFDTSYHEECIEAIDLLTKEIGAWFETGAIGKGQVVFDGIVFTAE